MIFYQFTIEERLVIWLVSIQSETFDFKNYLIHKIKVLIALIHNFKVIAFSHFIKVLTILILVLFSLFKQLIIDPECIVLINRYPLSVIAWLFLTHILKAHFSLSDSLQIRIFVFLSKVFTWYSIFITQPPITLIHFTIITFWRSTERIADLRSLVENLETELRLISISDCIRGSLTTPTNTIYLEIISFWNHAQSVGIVIHSEVIKTQFFILIHEI